MNDYDTLWKEYESLMLDFSDLLSAANTLSTAKDSSPAYRKAEDVLNRINIEWGEDE